MDIPQYDSVAEQYEYFVRNGAMRRIDEHTIFGMAGNVLGKSILDLACGFGYFSQEFYRRGASKVIGVDVSDKMIEIAQQKAKIENYLIQYEVADVIKMGVISRFDLVFAIWLFNYASSLDILHSMFKTCIDNLKDSGVLIAYTVNPSYSLANGNYTKYGFNIISEKQAEGCIRMEAEFVTPKPNQITFFRWNIEDYELIIRDLGISKFKWITPTLSRIDINKRSNDFWDTFIYNQFQVGLVCEL